LLSPKHVLICATNIKNNTKTNITVNSADLCW